MIKKILTKYNSMSTVVKASFWFTICSVLSKGMAFLTIPIFTRIMTTEEYGYVTLYNSWLLVMTTICTLQVTYGGFYNGMIKYKDDKDGYTSATLYLSGFMSLGWLIVYLLARNYVNKIFGLPTYIMILMFIEIITKSAFDTWVTRQKYEYNYKIQTAATLFCTVITPLLGVVLVLLMNDKVLGRVISFIIPYACLAVVLYYAITKKGKKIVCLKYWKFTLGFCIPLLPHYLSQTILSQSDRIMINNMIGTTDAAFYGFSYSIGALLGIFTQAINTSFIPWLYQRLEAKDYRKIGKSATPLVFIMAILVTFVTLLAPEAVWILGGMKYAEAVYVIPPIVSGCFFIFIYSLFSNVEAFYEKNKFIMTASIVAAVLNLVLNYIFIPMFGYEAAGYTTLFCYLVMSVTHYIGMKKVCALKGIEEDLYDLKMIVAISVAVILFAGVSVLLYKTFVLRYIIVLLIALVMFFKRNYIIQAFTNVKKKK